MKELNSIKKPDVPAVIRRHLYNGWEWISSHMDDERILT